MRPRRRGQNDDDDVVAAGVVVVKIGRVEEVETLQRAFHRQAEAGRAAPVARQAALRKAREGGGAESQSIGRRRWV